jgi:hypothetical protein
MTRSVDVMTVIVVWTAVRSAAVMANVKMEHANVM